ncbi:MAG: glycerol-3-phosphate 1-O-acyltransferase PlsY [Alphaproteobacteria bacterium]|nr:glycerol-3-phosphate 1-O-acyltransferase PlsY [Alphaproteobacteria bacterium]
MTLYIISCIVGYLLGSIPFGLIITYLAGVEDIRQIGSGNIGATNVLRTGHKFLALLTLLLDTSKAGLAAWLCCLFGNPEYGYLAGIFAVIGHNYPFWLHFQGGKGIASTLGLLLFMTPYVGIATCLTWLVVALIWHYSSLAALVALTTAPIYALIFNEPLVAIFSYALLCLLAFHTHRANIQRLKDGTEGKISF